MKHVAPPTAAAPLVRKNAGGGDEAVKLIEKLGSTVEEMKKANDERLSQLEKKGAADPVTLDKLKKIEDEVATLDAMKKDFETVKSALDDLSAKANRPRGVEGESVEQAEHRKSFGKFMRKGDDSDLAELQMKALNISVDGDGGYAVPEIIDGEISKLLVNQSPIRSLARVVTVGSSDYKKLYSTGGAGYEWVDENDTRNETDTPQLASVTPPIGEIAAQPAATQTMLDDVFFDAEAWLSQEVQDAFALGEGVAFVSGNGTKKPKGFLDYATAATKDGTRAFGTIQHIATGVADGFDADDPADILIDMFYALKAGHRQQSTWLMNSETVGTARKWKDNDGNYLWQQSLALGTPSTLIGRPVETDENMPGVAANSTPIALANWGAAYIVVDRMGTRVLRDPFTKKGFVKFYTTKRVGGSLGDSEAIKLARIAA